MAPAQQRLGAAYFTARHRYLGLEINLQRLFRQRFQQLGFERQQGQRVLVQRIVVESKAALILLGVVHGHVGVPHQVLA